MSQPAWQTEHSVETAASVAFAWSYMTDVTNWDDPPAKFRLDGPFVGGGHGTTEMPGQPERHWEIRDVELGASYTIALSLDRAIFLCTWRFKELPDGRTQLTQQITLDGENASAYLNDVQQAFGANLAQGMERIAAALNRAYAAG
jgi:hypothetical protein